MNFIDLRKTALFLTGLLLIARTLTAAASVRVDSLHIYVLDAELYTDTLDIGPEFDVPDDALLFDEEALPSFADMLDQFVVPFNGKVISKYGMQIGRAHV